MSNNQIIKSFALEKDQVEKLEAEARRQGGRSLSSLVRTIVDEWMEQHSRPVVMVDPRQMALVVEGGER